MHLRCTYYAHVLCNTTLRLSPHPPLVTEKPSPIIFVAGGRWRLRTKSYPQRTQALQARAGTLPSYHPYPRSHRRPLHPPPPPPCTFSRLSRSHSPYLPLRHPFTPLRPYSLAVGRSCGSLHGDATSLLAPAATTHRPLGGTAESEAGEGGREGGAQRRRGQGGTHPAGGLQPRIAA